MTIFETMEITASDINKHFVIRWREADDPSTKGNLIGAGRYAEKFGQNYADKHFEKAMSSGLQSLTVKIRGKFIIKFTAR